MNPALGDCADRDNTVEFGCRPWQIQKTPWRNTIAGCRVTMYGQLDGTQGVGYGPHAVD